MAIESVNCKDINLELPGASSEIKFLHPKNECNAKEDRDRGGAKQLPDKIL
jgi:hypothetical protein